MTEVGRLNVKVLASGAGDASLRQALEAIVIRKEDPPLNKKQEWTSEPRKRKIKSENQWLHLLPMFPSFPSFRTYPYFKNKQASFFMNNNENPLQITIQAPPHFHIFQLFSNIYDLFLEVDIDI